MLLLRGILPQVALPTAPPTNLTVAVSVRSGILTVGTLDKNGVCREQGTGFQPSTTTPLQISAVTGLPAPGAVMLPNEPGGNCVLR